MTIFLVHWLIEQVVFLSIHLLSIGILHIQSISSNKGTVTGIKTVIGIKTVAGIMRPCWYVVSSGRVARVTLHLLLL